MSEDKSSREDWEEAISKGLTLLGINYEERNEPFMGASGVTHPLLSEAVTQFQAQAYKEMLPPGGPVKTQIIGQQSKEVEDQAQRVKDFMNYQVTEVMEEYDLDTDQMLFYLPITGSTFKKVYFDPMKQRAVSKFVPAEDLIVPYSATDLQTAERYTHVVRMSENDIRKARDPRQGHRQDHHRADRRQLVRIRRCAHAPYTRGHRFCWSSRCDPYLAVVTQRKRLRLEMKSLNL